MRQLAQRIERATRNSFLDYEEEMTCSVSIRDREEIFQRMQQLKTDGFDYRESMKRATIEWIENLLMENCLKT